MIMVADYILMSTSSFATPSLVFLSLTASSICLTPPLENWFNLHALIRSYFNNVTTDMQDQANLNLLV